MKGYKQELQQVRALRVPVGRIAAKFDSEDRYLRIKSYSIAAFALSILVATFTFLVLLKPLQPYREQLAVLYPQVAAFQPFARPGSELDSDEAAATASLDGDFAPEDEAASESRHNPTEQGQVREALTHGDASPAASPAQMTAADGLNGDAGRAALAPGGELDTGPISSQNPALAGKSFLPPMHAAKIVSGANNAALQQAYEPQIPERDAKGQFDAGQMMAASQVQQDTGVNQTPLPAENASGSGQIAANSRINNMAAQLQASLAGAVTSGGSSDATVITGKPSIAATGLLQASLPEQTCILSVQRAAKGTQVQFDTGSATVAFRQSEGLRELASLVASCPEAKLDVGGHADKNGEQLLNLQLSWERAEAVIRHIKSLGFKTDQFSPVGYSATRPLTTDPSPQAQARNRRVEFTLR
jgi:outer membrane protein OmpA-like peptidoglycan-associated protein